MACGATLKRSIEFDPLYSPSQRSPKRRRCTPMTMSPATPPTKQQNIAQSPFGEVSPKMTTGQIAASLAMEIKRMARRKQLHFPHSGTSPPAKAFPVSQASLPRTTPPSQRSSPVASSSGEQSAHSSSSPNTQTVLTKAIGTNSKRELPLFTLKQVSLFCERLLKEREEHIREEYNKILTEKLAEQYESFLKFNHDQLHRRFEETAASYVS